MAPADHHHRSTLKQTNKSFKSRHSTKGSIKSAAKGKPAPSSLPTTRPSKQSQSQSQTKKARTNANAQKRSLKAKEVIDNIRFFSTSSNGIGVPRIISVIPLLPYSPSQHNQNSKNSPIGVSTLRWLKGFLPVLGLHEDEFENISQEIDVTQKGGNGEIGSYMIRAPRFKTILQINLLPSLDVYASLDAALVSDYVVLLLSSKDEVQLEGEGVLRCLQGQAGGVEVVTCVQSPEDQSLTPSTRNLVHKSLLSFTRYFFPAVDKIYSSDTPSEAALLARALCEAAPGGKRVDTGRAYLVAEGSTAVRWTPSTLEGTDGEEQGRLEITGTIRGGCLSSERLVHIPGKGDFQVEAIIPAPPSQLTLAARPHQKPDMAIDITPDPLSVPSEEADDLVSTNTPDLMANEQTWPTEEDMAQGMFENGDKRTKRVPKGTSAYQAAWIADEDDEDEDGDEEEDEEMDGEEGEDGGSEQDGNVVEEEEETEEIEMDSRRGEIHKDLDPEQEEQEYAAYLKRREKAQQEDMLFPDEIDTPRHIPARTRFQRYRGLKSFRTSPWDPYESLPIDYARIFQFENYAATRKRMEREAREEGVRPGTRVTLILKNVPRSIMDHHNPRLPFIVHGLLRHEHKQSVLHFVVQRNTEYTAPVRAKDPLILCVGPRRYIIRPLFSQHVRGGGKGINNVHKSERFLRPGTATVLTTFGPVVFGKIPCLLIRDPSVSSHPNAHATTNSVHHGDSQNEDDSEDDESESSNEEERKGHMPELIAMGNFLSPDPTRIIAKRIVLTGHPFKVHKKTATIRYMFFNREDVDWFKAIELHTKYGRVGHVQEPLGTHGYFKAHFDGPVGQMDTVCMNLYKRQFPKWSEPFSPPVNRAVENINHDGASVEEMEVE
ncbi:hypothetical protein TREMEDRAFT_74147 [Tremella mesenterica DSM 1558]|uniref:uncharacterized protein n=1 Tax=Tremella mesenterica (strain ATCC 24925 / CBS 8224 / DSM 1558 / NBRC 9311 / NRRL Y-6157 / RJB 2259-6 / UBC 559-6) TaxID=578456 RepID=UPI0003F4A1E0|nr:uncharacterized protein TREMEDRAFT_74147 [Tremella mesenterica DSM 1558]EIW68703.1 hypothetical protein TREMEDRAFT_74147 [Tremella mesenterica DSM 1558]